MQPFIVQYLFLRSKSNVNDIMMLVMVWVFTRVLGVYEVVVQGRGVYCECLLWLWLIAVGTRAFTVILSVEERTRDSQSLSALESSGGLANGGVREVTTKSKGWVQCSRNQWQLVVFMDYLCGFLDRPALTKVRNSEVSDVFLCLENSFGAKSSYLELEK